MSDSGLEDKLLHVKIVLHVSIHRLPNDVGSLLAVLLLPLGVPHGFALRLLLLPGQKVSNTSEPERQATYVGSRLQVRRIDGIFMESWPLLKRLLGACLVFFVVPVQHVGIVFEIYALAELLEDPFRLVEEVVRINHADLDSSFFDLAGIVTIGATVCAMYISVVWTTRPYLASRSEIIEYSTNLVVASFKWIKVVEARKLVKWWNGAAIVGWDARVRVAD